MEEVDLETSRPDPQDMALVKLPPSLERWEIVLKPCPWCFKTPNLLLPLEPKSGGTWTWHIECHNPHCAFKPKGRHVAVRKSQRYDLVKMKEKINLLANLWNALEYVYAPYEALQIPLEEWINFVKKNPGP